MLHWLAVHWLTSLLLAVSLLAGWLGLWAICLAATDNDEAITLPEYQAERRRLSGNALQRRKQRRLLARFGVQV